MAKVKCRVCGNEKGSVCVVKKIGVAVNKPRTCDVFIYDESKLKAKQEIPTIKVSFGEHQEAKRRMKEELKALKKEMNAGPSQGTAKDLGLIESSASKIITSENPEFYIPKSDPKHPLTGDLSRFLTTATLEG